MAALRQEFRRTEGGRSLSRAATSRKIGSLIFSSSYCSKTLQIIYILCTMISKKVKLAPNSLNTLPFCSLNPVQSAHSRETVQMARASIESSAFRDRYISTLLLSVWNPFPLTKKTQVQVMWLMQNVFPERMVQSISSSQTQDLQIFIISILDILWFMFTLFSANTREDGTLNSGDFSNISYADFPFVVRDGFSAAGTLLTFTPSLLQSH